MRLRKHLIAAALALGTAASAFAQAFPSKPITIVVPFPPGGTTDILARAIAAKMTRDLKPAEMDELGALIRKLGPQ